ncbi:MAG: response regulator transcription factor [Marinoscillum sp.]
MSKPNILLAEDDPNLSFVIADHLSHEGFNLITAQDGREALDLFTKEEINLCLVDVMMPKMDGFTLATEIRRQDEFVPILFLTARSMEEDRLRGFEIGGDDYISKPFSVLELTHRIRVFLRRSVSADTTAEPTAIPIGKLIFDQHNLQVIGEQKMSLTQMEGDLLKLLWKNRNQLVRREDILVSIWGENDYFKGRSLDVFISRLRKYLKEDPALEIRNHHGVGFSLVDGNFSG